MVREAVVGSPADEQIGSSPMWRRLMLDRKLTAKATEVATRREQ
jgi:hypothetical protein